MSDTHRQPTEQQLKPLLEQRRSTWKWLTATMALNVIGIFVLLGLMALFLA